MLPVTQTNCIKQQIEKQTYSKVTKHNPCYSRDKQTLLITDRAAAGLLSH